MGILLDPLSIERRELVVGKWGRYLILVVDLVEVRSKEAIVFFEPIDSGCVVVPRVEISVAYKRKRWRRASMGSFALCQSTADIETRFSDW